MSGVNVMVLALRAAPVAMFQPPLERVHGLIVPQRFAPPYILVDLISEPPETNLKGQTGAFESRVSLSCVGGSAELDGDAPVKLMAATNQIVSYLDLLRRARIGPYAAQFWKQGTDTTEADDDRLLPRRIMDYNVRWKRVA